VNILFSKKIHLPKFKKKSKKTNNSSYVLATLNNISQWYRYNKTKIKNDYKLYLKEWVVPEPNQQYEHLLIQYRIIRNSKRKLDKDNVIFALKWLADTLEEMEYIKNDQIVNFQSFNTIENTNLPETMLEIKIISTKQTWLE